jgi:hypothetical protein
MSLSIAEIEMIREMRAQIEALAQRVAALEAEKVAVPAVEVSYRGPGRPRKYEGLYGR